MVKNYLYVKVHVYELYGVLETYSEMDRYIWLHIIEMHILIWITTDILYVITQQQY